MPPSPRTLVAVVPSAADTRTHVLYFSDGTVVGYQPEQRRVVWEHQLAPDLGASGRPPAPPPADVGVPAAIAERERRAPTPGQPPPGGGRRVVDALPQAAEPG